MPSPNHINSILLFLPAKDEGASLAQVIQENRGELTKLGYEPDVLVIDDGSSDDTAKIAESSGAMVIVHKTNLGLGTTFSEAVRYAIEKKYDAMLTVDADGQFAATDIPALLDPVLSGTADMGTGSRFHSGAQVHGIPTIKRFGNYVMSFLISSILGKKFYDVSCGFRVYSREALLHMHLEGAFTYTQEVFLNLAHKRLRIVEVPITVQYFSGRKSRIANNLFRYASRSFKIIFKAVVYYAPLRLFGTFSVFLFCITVPVLAVLGARYLMIGLFSPYKGIGITALIGLSIACVSLATGIILQIVSKLQLTAEEILYYEKQHN